MVASGVEDERVRRDVREEEGDEVFLAPCVLYNFHGKERHEDDVLIELRSILQSECMATVTLHGNLPFVRYRIHVTVRPEDDVLLLQSEWPPSLFEVRVFSSRTGQFGRRGPSSVMARLKERGLAYLLNSSRLEDFGLSFFLFLLYYCKVSTEHEKN
jgi:hypothetical protein